jgi:ligand-binding sensor domain-containing protein
LTENPSPTTPPKDGLVNNWVYALHWDRGGILWIGTEGGLSHFEGKAFTNYTTQDGLVHNDVVAIVEARDGVLWLGTEGGLSRFDGKTFTNYTTQDGLATIMYGVSSTPQTAACG